MAGSPKSIDDKLRYMFVTSLGRDGGGVVLLPDSLTNADMDVDIGLKETTRPCPSPSGIRSRSCSSSATADASSVLKIRNWSLRYLIRTSLWAIVMSR